MDILLCHPSAADVLISWVPFMRDKQAGGWLRPAELEVTGPKCNSNSYLSFRKPPFPGMHLLLLVPK